MTFRYYTAQQQHFAADLTPCWICHEDFAVGEWLGEHRCSHFAHLECLAHLRDSVPAQELLLDCLCGARLPKTLLPEGANTREREGSVNTREREGSVNTREREGSANTREREGSVNTRNTEDESQGEVEPELNGDRHTRPAQSQEAAMQPPPTQASSEQPAPIQPAPAQAALAATSETPRFPRTSAYSFTEDDWRKGISEHHFQLGRQRISALKCRRGQLFTPAWNDLFIDTSPNTDPQDMVLIMGEIHMAEFERPFRRVKRLFFWQNAKTPLTDIAMAVYTMAYKDEPTNYHKMGMVIEIGGLLGYFENEPAKKHIGHGGTFVLHLPPCSF